MSNREILLKNTFWLALSKVLNQIINLFLVVLIVRKLSVEIFGEYNFLLNIYTLLAICSVNTITIVFNRYVPEFLSKNDFQIARKIVLLGIKMFIVAVFLVFFTIYLFKDVIAVEFGISNLKVYLPSLAVYSLAFGLKNIFDSLLRSLLLHRVVSLAEMAISLGRLALYLIFYDGLTVNIILGIESCLYLGFIIFVLTRNYLGVLWGSKQASISRTNGISRVTRFSILSTLNEIGAGLIGKVSGYYIVAAFSTPYVLGLYAFSLRIFNLFFNAIPVNEFMTVLRPVFFGKFSESRGRELEINFFYNLIVKLMLPIYTLPILIFAAFGKSIILLVFDVKYIEAYGLILLTMCVNVTTAFFYPLNLILQLRESMEINLYSKVSAVVNVLGGIWAMQNYGVIGLATTLLIGDLVKNLIMFFLVRRQFPLRYPLQGYVRYLIYFAIMLMLAFMISQLFPIGLILLIPIALGFLGVSLCFLLLSGYMDPTEVGYLKSVLSTSKPFNKLALRFKSLNRFFSLQTN